MILPDFRATRVLVFVEPGYNHLCAQDCRFKLNSPEHCSLFNATLLWSSDLRIEYLKTHTERCAQCMHGDHDPTTP